MPSPLRSRVITMGGFRPPCTKTRLAFRKGLPALSRSQLYDLIISGKASFVKEVWGFGQENVGKNPSVRIEYSFTIPQSAALTAPFTQGSLSHRKTSTSLRRCAEQKSRFLLRPNPSDLTTCTSDRTPHKKGYPTVRQSRPRISLFEKTAERPRSLSAEAP